MKAMQNREREIAGQYQGAAMKKGWQTKKLGDLCDVVGGGTPPKDKPSFYSGEIPWATVRDMRQDVITETEFRITKDAVKSSATNIIPSGNVVIATRVGLGKVCLLGQDTAINQDLRGIVPRIEKTLAVRYLYWWLKSISDAIVAEGTGATVQGVKLPFVKSLQIPVPPLAEQQRIVSLLDEAFEGLATAKANAEKNLQNARALFESHLQSVFTQRGPGWVEKPFEDCIEDVKYTTKIQRKEFLDEGEFPIVSQEAEFTNGYWDNAADVFKVTRPIVVFGDHTQVLKYIDFDFVLGADGVKLLPPKPFLNPKFFFYALRSAPLKSLGYARHYRLLKEIQIGYPDTNAQVGIAKKLDALEAETQRLDRLYERKSAALEALKKSLLHQAFSGEL